MSLLPWRACDLRVYLPGKYCGFNAAEKRYLVARLLSMQSSTSAAINPGFARCAMAKYFAAVVVLLGCVHAIGQNPPSLDLYTSSDNSFSFAYPDTYDLMAGDSILRRTQGKHAGIPVCDSLAAVACVIYPFDNFEHSRFEAAAFSVNRVSIPPAEQQCMGFADQLPPNVGEHLSVESVRINGQPFRYAATTKAITGHSQSAQRYRSFHKGRCYELRIAISVSDLAQGTSSQQKALDEELTDKIRRSLQLILSSFVFAE